MEKKMKMQNKMKSLSQFLKRRGYITILLLLAVGLFLYILCFSFLGLTFFCTTMAQVAGSIGAQGLSNILIKMGCCSSLAFFLGLAFRAFFTTGVSYMYSSLFEVSQWCKVADLFGKRKLILIRVVLVTAFLLLSFLLAKGVGAVCLFYNLVSKSCVSMVVHFFVKSMGLKGVSLFLVGAILRWCLSPSALFMMGPSGSGLPDLNEPAAPEEPLLEPQEASGEEILRVRRRLERYMQVISGQTAPPRFRFFDVSLPKTFQLEQGVSRARLRALDSFIEEEEGRVLAGDSTMQMQGLLRLKKKNGSMGRGTYGTIKLGSNPAS